MTFKDYLGLRRAGFDAEGDFMRLAKADPDLPEVTSWTELHAYMEARGTPALVLAAGPDVWADYLDMQRRRARAA